MQQEAHPKDPLGCKKFAKIKEDNVQGRSPVAYQTEED